MTIILGIDPGTRVTGYGVIRKEGGRCEPVDFGCIRPPIKGRIEERYLIIFEGIDHLLEKYQPNAVAVETQFVKKNVQSALKLGRAHGAVLIAAARRSVPIFEYAPRKAKMAVVGTGSATKQQVQMMIQMQLKLKSIPEPEDAADALALALCHAYNERQYV